MTRSLTQDLRAHGLRAATRKRFAEFDIGGETLSYRRLLARDGDELERLLGRAIRDEQYLAACWVFEALLYASGDLERAWGAVSHALSREDDEHALAALQVILRSVDDPWWLAAAPQERRCLALLGRHFVARAGEAQASNQNQLELNRSLALAFLGRAREMPDVRDGVEVLALAAAYESALYVRFTNADAPNE